jgi:uncharacterized membrane protein
MVKHDDHEPRPSKAAIAGHPIHPMLIPFPVALLSLVAVTDIAFAAGAGLFWAKVSYYMLWAGIISAGIAALAGLVDFLAIKRARSHRQGWFHALAMVGVIALAVVNLLLRLDDYAATVVPSGLILSVVGAGLLSIGAWFGGELSYRHKIGVVGREDERPEKRPPIAAGTEPRRVASGETRMPGGQHGPGLEQPTSL